MTAQEGHKSIWEPVKYRTFITQLYSDLKGLKQKYLDKGCQ